MAIYRSNLTAPDLSSYFMLCPQVRQIMGHDAPSDPDFDPDCTYLTHDEAAILYSIAKAWPGSWVDIGARLGWTGAHIAAAGCPLSLIDPEYKNPEFYMRMARYVTNFRENPEFYMRMDRYLTNFRVPIYAHSDNSESFFIHCTGRIDAAMIDGDHDAPQPTLDAIRAVAAGAKVLVWHDFWGEPIQQAVSAHPKDQWGTRVYNTPNGMAVCWLAGCGFVPPDHTPDPAIDWAQVRRDRAPNFDFGRCS